MKADSRSPRLIDDADRVSAETILFSNLRDSDDRVQFAAVYNEEGADELVFLEITGSGDDRRTMVDVVARSTCEVFVPFEILRLVRTKRVDDGLHLRQRRPTSRAGGKMSFCGDGRPHRQISQNV